MEGAKLIQSALDFFSKASPEDVAAYVGCKVIKERLTDMAGRAVLTWGGPDLERAAVIKREVLAHLQAASNALESHAEHRTK